MLRRLTLAFLALLGVAAIAACSSGVQNLNIGPSFPTLSLYVTNSTQNAISIYAPNPSSSAAPLFQIGGSNTQLNGPQYLAFDAQSNLYTTNYNPGTAAASVLIYKSQATGNVIPFGQISGSGSGIVQPRGIAIASTGNVYVANVSPASQLPSSILVFGGLGSLSPSNVIQGTQTGLNFPAGVALDSNNNLYVANRGSANVLMFNAPTPGPSPTATPMPTATPTATPTPNPSASPTATPTPMPVPTGQPPNATIGGSATGLVSPVGIAVDGAGNIYVVDAGAGNAGVRVFAPKSNGNVAPTRTINYSGFVTPTDVKLDKSGNIYVADPGAGKVFIFAAAASGNATPMAIIPASGNVVGLALAP
ncbi:MAG: NHL repeat-containing protein [Candidatus Eremiobacteraeota bacterium]|nr:NHL repeat-containing protein [Candidatus Eremiobacteraeota bacterium]